MDLQRIDKAIERYDRLIDEGVLEDMGAKAQLAFFRGIWGVQDRYSRGLENRGAVGELPGVDKLDSWYWDEQPILSYVPAKVEASELTGCVKDLTGWIAENGHFDANSMLELSSYDWSQLTTPECMRLAGSDPVSLLEIARVRSGSDMVIMVLSLALRAMLEPTQKAIMRALHDRLIEENLLHRRPVRCPVCGDVATIAYVGATEASAGNGRRLYCSQCGAAWEFERIRCARCGCTDGGKLHYYNMVGDETHRLHECDECGGYIRTAFFDKDAHEGLGGAGARGVTGLTGLAGLAGLAEGGLVAPEVEDVVMTRLDALAHSGSI